MQYKGTQKPLPQIARELNVDAVVEGAVRRSGARVRVTARLIGAVPERHLWARSYDRDLRDVLTLESEVARAIAEEHKDIQELSEFTKQGLGTFELAFVYAGLGEKD